MQAGARQVAELACQGGGHIVLHISISDVVQTLESPLAVLLSTLLHPNICPLQHARDEAVPSALLTCVPHHPGHL